MKHLLIYSPVCQRSQTVIRLLREHNLLADFNSIEIAAIPPEKRPLYVPTMIITGAQLPLHGNEIYNWINNTIRLNQRTNNILVRDRVDANADPSFTPVLLESKGLYKQQDSLRGLNTTETKISNIYTTVQDGQESQLQNPCESVHNYNRPVQQLREERVRSVSSAELAQKERMSQQSRQEAESIIRSKMRDFIPTSLIYGKK